MRLSFHRFHTMPFALVLCLLGLPPAVSGQQVGQKPSQLPAKQATAKQDPRLGHAYRFERAHWTYVHLQGTPTQIGFQHGWLLAPEIEDAFHVVQLENTHATRRNWGFFRQAAQKVLWPHIETEYRQELQGIVDGLRAHGVRDMDLWDVVALNGMIELPEYYVPMLDRQQHTKNAPKLKAPGDCSAFVATGDWTRDHRPVIAHNNWSSFMDGERWHIIFDIVPEHGHPFLMDGFPGNIDSADDFGVNAAGIAITETTITGYDLFDPNGVPEFVRARKAMQYASSIDDYVDIMLKDNNGGYGNDWLLADNKTGEIARFELGLTMHHLWRTSNGYFVGSNFPSDPEFIRKETDFNPNDPASSPNARHKRWDALMAQYKGQIDVALAEQFLADHTDAYTGQEARDERTLCGHVDNSPRGVPEWSWPAFDPAGAVSAKAADSSMIAHMSLTARAGRPCGEDFLAGPFLAKHPQFDWERPLLRDMPGSPWASFHSGDKASH
jgi:hypothetical protein